MLIFTSRLTYLPLIKTFCILLSKLRGRLFTIFTAYIVSVFLVCFDNSIGSIAGMFVSTEPCSLQHCIQPVCAVSRVSRVDRVIIFGLKIMQAYFWALHIILSLKRHNSSSLITVLISVCIADNYWVAQRSKPQNCVHILTKYRPTFKIFFIGSENVNKSLQLSLILAHSVRQCRLIMFTNCT